MSEEAFVLDCRGLSRPLTVLRAKQAIWANRSVRALDLVVEDESAEDAVLAGLLGEDVRVRVVVHPGA